MGLITGMLLLAGSAALIGGKSISSNVAKQQLATHNRNLGTNYQRQLDVQYLSHGKSEADKKEFLELLGRDFDFELASPYDRQQAIYEISLKEGWTYIRQAFTPSSCQCYDCSKDTYAHNLAKKL